MKQMSTATVRRAFLGLVPIIMVMLGYGEVFMSQAKHLEGSRTSCWFMGVRGRVRAGRASTTCSRRTATTCRSSRIRRSRWRMTSR